MSCWQHRSLPAADPQTICRTASPSREPASGATAKEHSRVATSWEFHGLRAAPSETRKSMPASQALLTRAALYFGDAFQQGYHKGHQNRLRRAERDDLWAPLRCFAEMCGTLSTQLDVRQTATGCSSLLSVSALYFFIDSVLLTQHLQPACHLGSARFLHHHAYTLCSC